MAHIRPSCQSPYWGPVLRLQFMGGATAHVPREVINKHPVFAARFSRRSANELLNLLDVLQCVGHTIVHFLFTGTYQTLPGPLDNATDRHRVLLSETMNVYFEALNLGLGKLSRLATKEIVRHGREISFTEIIKVLDDDFPELTGNETWLTDYLVNRATMENELVTDESIQNFRAIMGDQRVVVDILEGILKLKIQLQRQFYQTMPQ
ncbi:hypothetical protein LCI18_002748 [Fusarium solani-melongenae]|uniref:Uncharacterized protein n=1 Tax=Fusarium solani subsp. cucurbitae TaxID=2747967 RepID=A0ACD3YSI8_FUSSC|nr:hypothetical protein LCI18_002748 [Fusarium solani-melongenae]